MKKSIRHRFAGILTLDGWRETTPLLGLIGAMCLVWIFACSIAFAAEPTSASQSKISPLIGTWELISEKWGDEQTFSSPRSDRKSLKFITQTHFVWVWIDPKTGRITNSMGGTYKHDGESYLETVEFVVGGMQAYLNKDQKFTARIEGDIWFHSGQLSEGQKLEEIWKRVSSE